MAWHIQYENDQRPTIKTYGSREQAEAMAQKRNKYGESYSVTQAPRDEQEIADALEQYELEAIKYGLAFSLRAADPRDH